MYLHVRLIKGWGKTLLYSVADEKASTIAQGQLVTVPLQKRHELGIIESITSQLSEDITFEIREIDRVESCNDPTFHTFLEKLSAYQGISSTLLYKKIATFFKERTVPVTQEFPQHFPPINLTSEQETAVAAISPTIQNPQFQPWLLHGVTGSGKTEVYTKCIEEAAKNGKSTIFLVPEISLAIEFAQRLKISIPIYNFHSATSAKEKKQAWNAALAGKTCLIIGVHLPLLIPCLNLGLLIVDEEHESTYQSQQHPKINSKEAALLRAQIKQIPIILGSATPSISSLYNVEDKGWKLLQLKNRFAGSFPHISLVSLRNKDKRAHFWLSNQLVKGIEERLAKREQTMIFLNRRGHSFFMQCLDCGFIARCTSCSVSLTFHEPSLLICHYCNYTIPALSQCPTCHKKQLLKKGIGTQQIVSSVQKLFPHARIARADLDTTMKRKLWQTMIHDFSTGALDILVGTQTITKGYHFPFVTLVGIIWADMHLSIPHYTAVETTIQQLVQVAGRAGRFHPSSDVILQTITEHDLYQYLNETSYREFYEYEKQFRKELGYPPFMRFAELELRHETEAQVEKDADFCANLLHSFENLTILGPSKPPVFRIKNIEMRKLYIKSTTMKNILHAYAQIRAVSWKSSLYFTPNPLHL